MELAIELDFFAAIRDEHGSVVGAFLVLIDRAEEQIGLDRGGKVHDEAIILFIDKNGARHRAFRPDNEIGRKFCDEGHARQPGELIERLLLELARKFLFSGDVCLHGRHAQRHRFRMHLQDLQAVSTEADDRSHC